MTYRAEEKHKRLSILHKGLIIISIPLVFELFFVLVLMHLLDESSKHIAAEIRSQDKIVCVETMIKELADSTTSAILFNVNRREELMERNNVSRIRLTKNFSKLLKLTEDNPKELDAAKRLIKSANGWMSQQDNKAFEISPQARMIAFFDMPGATEAQQLLVMRPEGAARVIIDAEQEFQSMQPQLRQQSILRLQILIFFGLAVHISITVFLAFSFGKYISQRLANVLSNTLKLGARKPLDPPLRGTDEIADLDHALHATASDILNFERFKEQLIGVVSHELRTPLTSVQGTLTLIEAGALGQFQEDAMEEIRLAQSNTGKLIELVNNLLLLERLEAGSQVMKEERFDLLELVRNILDSRNEFIEENSIEIECEITASLNVLGDHDRLAQALAILIDTSLSRAPENSKISITGEVEKDRLELMITDTGAPLSAAQVRSYFDRMREPLESEEGKSRLLFLALCQAIVNAHDGTVSVQSEAQETTFKLRLPVRRRSDD